MTQLNDLKRLEKESQHLYDNAHDDMSDYFKDVLELIFTHERLMQSYEQLQSKLDKACEALEKVKHNGCCMVCSSDCPACNAHQFLSSLDKGE